MKYLRSLTLKCKDIGIRKSEFVTKTQFLIGFSAQTVDIPLNSLTFNAEYLFEQIDNILVMDFIGFYLKSFYLKVYNKDFEMTIWNLYQTILLKINLSQNLWNFYYLEKFSIIKKIVNCRVLRICMDEKTDITKRRFLFNDIVIQFCRLVFSRAVVVHLNFRAGSTFLVLVCTGPNCTVLY